MIEIETPKSVIGEVLNVAKAIRGTRFINNVFLSLTEEVGELATEMAVRTGHSSKISGQDGIKGEAVDIIICALDILHLEGCDEQEIVDILKLKSQKWLKNKS